MENSPQQTAQGTPNTKSQMQSTYHTYFDVTGKVLLNKLYTPGWYTYITAYMYIHNIMPNLAS